MTEPMTAEYHPQPEGYQQRAEQLIESGAALTPTEAHWMAACEALGAVGRSSANHRDLFWHGELPFEMREAWERIAEREGVRFYFDQRKDTLVGYLACGRQEARASRDALIKQAERYRTELLAERAAACPPDCPCRQLPLTARWDREVIHPTPGDTEDTDTIVCCIADGGQPVALLLDDDLREALGLQLLLPDRDGEVDVEQRVRAEALREGADALDAIADYAEARVLAHYNGACGAGSCDMVRESARTLREMADGRPAPVAVPAAGEPQ